MSGNFISCMAIVLTLSCGPKGSSQPITVEQFNRCFLNPFSCGFVLSKSTGVSSEQLDSLANRAACARASTSGAFTAILRDSLAVDYTLGYLTPPVIKADTTYPLVIYLHGGTGSTLSTKGEKAYDMLRPLADTFNLFLASPSANRFAPWWSPAGIGRILQTLRFMTLHYPINRDKIFLAGVSDGATGCYAAANAVPSPFAGFIAVSGFGGMLPSVGMPLYPSNIMQRPIYNVNAGKDRIYDIVQVNKFLDWLIEQGVRVERKEYPEELHGFDYRDREFGTIANYLRSWSRPADKNQVNWTAVTEFPNCADNLVGFVPINASPSQRIAAFWKNDTLEISANGMREAIVSFPRIGGKSINVCLNNAKTRHCRALPKDALLSYRLMMHTCFPVGPEFACYRIRF